MTEQGLHATQAQTAPHSPIYRGQATGRRFYVGATGDCDRGGGGRDHTKVATLTH